MINIIGNIGLPRTLYKYRIWNSKMHRQIIDKRIVYFASPALFNDPFDCKIPIRYDINSEQQLENIYYRTLKAADPNREDNEIRSFSKRFTKEGPVDHRVFKKNNSEYFENLNKRMGVLSLSGQNNDILMWGHYADSHRGFCIGFDTSELLKTEEVDYIGKVDYYPEFPIIIPNGKLEYQFEKQIFSKWNKWEYENEFRLTKNHIENRKIRLSTSVFSEIILGYKMPIKERMKLIKLVSKRLNGIAIYEAIPHEEMFMIEIKRIE